MAQQLSNDRKCPYIKKINGRECPLGHIPPEGYPDGFVLPSGSRGMGPSLYSMAYKEVYCECNVKDSTVEDEYKVLESAAPTSLTAKLPKSGKRMWHYCQFILQALHQGEITF